MKKLSQVKQLDQADVVHPFSFTSIMLRRICGSLLLEVLLTRCVLPHDKWREQFGRS